MNLIQLTGENCARGLNYVSFLILPIPLVQCFSMNYLKGRDEWCFVEVGSETF